MNQPLTECDVAVIGGGPAGAAAGAVLARGGMKVVILEKESFPRFCVGESLLPHGNDLLRELGVWPKLEASGFLRKYGAEFCSGDRSMLQRFWFSQNMDPGHEYSYQVDRASFDKLLLDHAGETGCTVREQTRVLSLEETESQRITLRCTGKEGESEVACRWLIDASGRNAFAGQRVGFHRRQTQKGRRAAIYGHFEGVHRNSGKAEGHITIVRKSDGWFWMIPLAGNRTSVGLVLPAAQARGGTDRTLEEIFREAVKATPEVRARMAESRPLTPLLITGDYSWKFSSFAGRRILLTGDAAGFVDPIFSSGVMLALKSAMRAASLVLRADASGRSLSRPERWFYTREVTGWMNRYAWIIRCFYDRAGFEVLMHPSPLFRIPASIGRLVGGETRPHLADTLRFAAFLVICRVQRFLPVVPTIPSLR
jgi:flavin-dependent dehydrogenase